MYKLPASRVVREMIIANSSRRNKNARMFSCLTLPKVIEHLTWIPAVGILGPRQVGKTAVPNAVVANAAKSIYLDLYSPGDKDMMSRESVMAAARRSGR